MFALALALSLAAGCMLSPLRPYEPELVRGKSVALDVPLVQQEDKNTCGFAAITMLLRYYGASIQEADRELVRRSAGTKEGVSGRLMEEVLERNGFRVYIFPGTLLDEKSHRGIAYNLKQGWPPVVMVSPRGKRTHYMVVSGLSVEKDQVFFEDPDKGKVACSGRAFRKMWERGNFFTLVAVPKKIRPRR
jgi:ABC-type bacteriocin/lantibiotic exporter with double-glycine peptidase domain